MKTEKANKLIVKGLLNMGAIVSIKEPFFSTFLLQTKCGELKVILDTPRPRSKILACYSIFKDVEKAKKEVNCNPYSGKWNFCVFSKDYTAEAFAELVICSIKPILSGNLNIPPEEWLKKLFECENCSECHRGAKSHTATPFNGNWFARCNPIKKRFKNV